MPTQEQVQRRVEDFEREYGERSLAGRMEWWAHALGIDRKRLFRLLGVPAAEAGRMQLTDLERVVSANEELAEQIDDLLGQILASYDYDRHAMSEALHRPAGGARPRAGVLLNEIVAGGPTALAALLAYLSRPATGQ